MVEAKTSTESENALPSLTMGQIARKVLPHALVVGAATMFGMRFQVSRWLEKSDFFRNHFRGASQAKFRDFSEYNEELKELIRDFRTHHHAASVVVEPKDRDFKITCAKVIDDFLAVADKIGEKHLVEAPLTALRARYVNQEFAGNEYDARMALKKTLDDLQSKVPFIKHVYDSLDFGIVETREAINRVFAAKSYEVLQHNRKINHGIEKRWKHILSASAAVPAGGLVGYTTYRNEQRSQALHQAISDLRQHLPKYTERLEAAHDDVQEQPKTSR